MKTSVVYDGIRCYKKNNVLLWCMVILPVLVTFHQDVFAQQKTTIKQENILPVDPQVKIGHLSNGLTYYILKNTEPKNRAELYLINKVGSLLEDDDQQGLAHFTEHMAFNGTRDFPKNALIDYLQRSGVRFGADLNAYTSFDETVYQLPLPTDDAALFRKGFDILLNWAGCVSFEAEEIDRERGVILEEERQRGKNAQDRMNKQIYPVLMAGSQYALRMPIGKTDILKNFEHKTIRRYYKDWYRPDLQAIVAVGDFDVPVVEQLIKEKFASLKNPKKERPYREFAIPENKQPLVKIVTDPEYSYTSATIFYKHQKQVIRTREDYTMALMINMINNMFADRMQEVKNRGEAPFLAAEGSYEPFIGNLAAFTLNVVAKEAGELQKAMKAVMDEAVRMKRYGFTVTELERAKQSLLSGMEVHYKEKDKIASSYYVREYQRHFLSGEAIPGIEYEYKLYQDIIPAISLQDINVLAARLMTIENRVLILQANEKDKGKLPDEATLLSWILHDRQDIMPYIDQTTNEPLLATVPAAGKVVAERTLDNVGATELILSNGMTVVLKPTNFKNDQILFAAMSPGGQSLGAERDFRSAQYASSLINASGLASFNDVQLRKLLAGRNISVNAYIGNYEEGITGSATPKDLEAALQLTHLYFTAPRKDTAVFHTMLEDMKINIRNRYTNPAAVFQDTAKALMSSWHPWAKTLSEPEITAMNQDAAIAFYRQRFADAGDFTFFFTGNFTVSELKPLICTYLASLPAQGKKEHYKDLGMKPVSGNVKRTVTKGLEDKAVVALIYHGTYDYSDQENIKINALRSVLQLRLTERLREKEGGVYSPSVSDTETKIPSPQYTLQVSFSCSTANVERLIEAVMEEVSAIRTKGISAEDMMKFVAEEKRQLELQVRENSFWISYLKSVYKTEHPMDFLQNYPTMLSTLTADQVKEAANKFLNDKNFIRLVLLPEKTAQ